MVINNCRGKAKVEVFEKGERRMGQSTKVIPPEAYCQKAGKKGKKEEGSQSSQPNEEINMLQRGGRVRDSVKFEKSQKEGQDQNDKPAIARKEGSKKV